jgi:hypothetical protein
MDWIDLAKYKGKWKAPVDTVTNFMEIKVS